MYRIVADHQHYIVIDKSPNVGFHTEGGVFGVAEQLKRDLGAGALYPVHRLDRMTSRLLLFAKDRQTARCLAEQFEQRQVQKFYLALSDRKPKKKQGLVKGDMEKGRRGSWKLLTSNNNPAVTRFFSCHVEPGLRLFLLKPQTGKTHQLRVAMKSIGAPVLGDSRYSMVDPGANERGYLHAYGLGFTLDGKSQRFICSPTEGEAFNRPSFAQALLAYQDPWELSWP